ncbi:Maf family nucleotide pyrophosphatase [Psychroflexus sp. ALD_RP9]|uniref:Maf family nucleotide pyrophosphatase n=1 Tax=Psychroflexus sp. ALD_RP9 TaxID=2777186 RepID=UPI001A8C6580|nr:Maf family nucleotide pyrophosphatase [Psychroflexus sp. ALD_RP9]QSS97415.1 septum formation protein Maf [Psychroflexus sp. ALD_RP9]
MLPLIEKANKIDLILASGSPRRKEILQQLGFKFQVETRPIDEVYPEHLNKTEISDFLAEQKAKAFEDIPSNTIVITGDTIVWHENKALGKPTDYREAVEMLESLSGQTHEVISSLSLKTKKTITTVHETTQVSFKKLDELEISHYINTYLPYDKAGAYGIQEWIGQIGITKIEGSFYNVMGFPTRVFYEALKEVINQSFISK